MDSLNIEKEQGEFFVILHLAGELNPSTFFELESTFHALLDLSEPEFILLDCAKLEKMHRESLSSLQKVAHLFSEQARELAICNLSETICPPTSFVPPLGYYHTQEEALNAFSESLPQHDPPSGLFPILTLKVIAKKHAPTVTLRENSEVIIGRHSQCDLSIPYDLQISRFHCKCYEKLWSSFRRRTLRSLDSPGTSLLPRRNTFVCSVLKDA